MKYKLLSIAVVVLMVTGAFALQSYEPKNNRYHQHLEAEEKAACTDHGADTFCTHLPLMSIVTDGPVPAPYLYDAEGNQLVDERGMWIKNGETVAATVTYFDRETENNHLTDEPGLTERAVIRVRGASSRSFDKKGYALEFRKENGVDSKAVSLSGMTADSDWVLHGPFLDKSLIRNYVCYNMAGEIMDYAPNVRFCELFLNGEYLGVYLIVEKIGYNADGRINISKTDPDRKETSYIVQVDRGTEDPLHALDTFASYSYLTATKNVNNGQLEIIYPGAALTQAQKNYIEDDISRFEKALFSFDYNDKERGYRNYIDVDSFVDYFLINEFGLNYDAMGLSTFLYKDVRGKLNLCVWDFNSAFDYYEYSSVTPETFLLQNQMWYQYLFKDEAFVDEVVDRYYELRESWFDAEFMDRYIDETVAYLGDAVERNFEKWGYSFQSTCNGTNYDYLIPEERNVRSHEEAILQIKECIAQRVEHMDSRIDRLYSLCHESLNKKYNHEREGWLP